MGHVTYLHGYIIGDYDYEERNSERLAALPEEDTWPCLTRDLFAVPKRMHSYEGQIISFGTVYNGVERQWEMWLYKFEELLRTLYWFEAHVHLKTEMWGTYHYTWKATASFELPVPDRGPELPVQSWTFAGGPRSRLRESYRATNQ